MNCWCLVRLASLCVQEADFRAIGSLLRLSIVLYNKDD